jgi:SulP family sulfate permease
VLQQQQFCQLIAMTTLFSAGLQIFYGSIGGGRLIKFIPFQVVTGYLSGVALLIALGQLPKLLGLPKGITLFKGIFTPELWKWQGVVVGVSTILVMALGQKLTKKIPAAILGLFAGVVVYFLLGVFYPELLKLSENPLIIGPINTSGNFLESVQRQLQSLLSVDWKLVKLTIVPALTLSVLLSIDTLKTCVALDALTKNRHNSDRELIGQGLGNLTSCLIGGMPGAGAMGPTLVNLTSGGRTWRAGTMEGIFVLLAMLLLGKFIAWVPIGALAGILLVIAWRMFDRSMFSLLNHRSGRLDFAVIAGVILVALTVDLIAASGVGIALAIILFVRDQMRGTVILRKSNLKETPSKTRRSESEMELLNRMGNQAVICRLQGNLFFGTTDQLFTQLQEELKSKKFVLLDMRKVQSIDFTAVHLFEQMNQLLEENSGHLLFSGMPSGLYDRRNFEKYLAHMGLVGKGTGVLIFETLDGSLEWMEEQILKDNGFINEKRSKILDLSEFKLFRELNEMSLVKLRLCTKEISLKAGEHAFSYGETGDELFLVRKGALSVLLPLAGTTQHHIATVSRGSFFGEMSFLDREKRSANVVAKEDTELYVLSRQTFNEKSLEDAQMGVQIFARLALAISARLRETDNELRVAEER